MGLSLLMFVKLGSHFIGWTCSSLFFLPSSRSSSRRARTMESLTSIYAEEDVVKNLEESARMQRAYANYFDLVVVDESHDQTYREVMEAWYALSIMDQWVPSTWVYSWFNVHYKYYINKKLLLKRNTKKKKPINDYSVICKCMAKTLFCYESWIICVWMYILVCTYLCILYDETTILV